MRRFFSSLPAKRSAAANSFYTAERGEKPDSRPHISAHDEVSAARQRQRSAAHSQRVALLAVSQHDGDEDGARGGREAGCELRAERCRRLGTISGALMDV